MGGKARGKPAANLCQIHGRRRGKSRSKLATKVVEIGCGKLAVNFVSNLQQIARQTHTTRK
jgi:hypothetical protein